MPICPMMNIANHIRVGSYSGLKLVNMVDAPIAAESMTGRRNGGTATPALPRCHREEQHRG